MNEILQYLVNAKIQFEFDNCEDFYKITLLGSAIITPGMLKKIEKTGYTFEISDKIIKFSKC